MLATKYIPINIGTILDAFFPVFRKEYWFFTMYILLFLLIPYINIGIGHMSKKAHGALCIIILAFFYVEPLLSAIFYQYDSTEGFSIVAFVTLYLIGSYLSRCGSIRKKWCVIMLILSSCTMLMSKVILQFLVDRYSLNFGTGLLYHNNSLFVLINAVALFELFLQKRVDNRLQKVATWITPSIFSVYLLHEKPAIRKIIWNERLVQLLNDSSFVGYVAFVLGVGLVIFIIGVLTDKIFNWIIYTRVEKSAFAERAKKKCSEYNMIISNYAK